MALKQQLLGRAIEKYLGEGFADLRRKVHGLRDGDVLELYHQVDDPYSHLLLQLVPKLVSGAGLSLEVVIVPAPSPAADPAPALRRAYALRDAKELARRFELSFPSAAEQPSEQATALANSILLFEREPASELLVAEAVGDALFHGDIEALEQQRDRFGALPLARVAAALERGAALLRKRGHYSGGMLRHRGIWYWGVDRLHHLEAELRRTGRAAPHGLVPRDVPEPAPAPEGERPSELSMYHSFRSPYSYIVLERAAELAARHGVSLRILPVLPMVMRGLQVPRIKSLYIARDVAREARSMNVPFGRLCDPLGPGIARCMALFVLAEQEGRGYDFALSAGRGIWSEALDVSRDDDLRHIAERAGLVWNEASAALDDDSWRSLAERNRDELSSLGLWGVPCFRFGDYSVWGQDRLDSLEERMATAEARGA